MIEIRLDGLDHLLQITLGGLLLEPREALGDNAPPDPVLDREERTTEPQYGQKNQHTAAQDRIGQRQA